MSISYSSSISSSPSRSRSRLKKTSSPYVAGLSAGLIVRRIGPSKKSSPLVVGGHTNETTAGPGVRFRGFLDRPRFLKIRRATP